MPIRETHALRREPVNVRRGNLAALGIVALHIAIAEIVGEDDENVGHFARCVGSADCAQRGEQQGSEEGEGVFHDSSFGGHLMREFQSSGAGSGWAAKRQHADRRKRERP